MGSQTGLSPILSLVSMYVGMRLAGVLGMILGPVLCLVLINVCRTGIFDGLLGDLRLAVRDTAAILNSHPARRPPAPGERIIRSKRFGFVQKIIWRFFMKWSYFSAILVGERERRANIP